MFGSTKSLGSRLRSSLHQPTGQRRTRTAQTSKRLTKHKAVKTKAKPTFEFDVTSVGPPPEMLDVEMGDATPTEPTPARTTKRYRLPRELRRPALKEVAKETLSKIDPELGDAETMPDVQYIRDWMEEMGPGLLRTALNITVDPPKDTLPPTVTVQLNNIDPISQYPPPTHMLAIHTTARTTANARRAVTLVPTHSIVLALHCANLPAFAVPGSTPSYASPGDESSIVLPVQPLRIPHPATFAPLATFLYTQRTDALLKALFPIPPPPDLGGSENADADRQFAGHLAQTYTPQALLTHALRVHGLWQNIVALGVHTDELWDSIELAWEVLLTAIGFATGTEVDLLASEAPSSGKPTPTPTPTPALVEDTPTVAP
ncbi:hypothetical protein C8F01DRAFT_992458 [Mycena amicta]|nr:hypothetical protein C8F01DRAFT_992458 [Mycena amicta]